MNAPQPIRGRLARFAARRRYPIWQFRPVAITCAGACAAIAVLVSWVGHRSVLAETEITLGVIAVGLFALLSIGLYRGVRVRREALPSPRGLSWETVSRWTPDCAPDIPDVSCDADEGIIGVILGIILSIVVLLLVTGLLIVVVNAVWIALAALALGVFWVFNRALRQVFARSRACRGRLAASLAWAAVYTVGYSGWLFALLWLVQVGRHRV